VPDADVKVYGSHATQLCLHWSDVDLVLIPPDSKHMLPNEYRDIKSNSTSGGLLYSNKNWLATVYQELMREEQIGSNWLISLKFIENTAVPVIKLQCSYIAMQKDDELADTVKLTDGTVSRYPEILRRPINIDITLMTEHHNGILCVNLVKQFLKENQVIEPLILVLKQILKVWGFNEPYNGGLSSYALFLMIVSFL
jgi:DNA polymerase sigma